MSRREEIFRFRLNEEEQARLAREAAERGLSKADRIREALGWEPRAAPKAASPATVAALSKSPSGPKPDPKREPGKSAIEELAERLKPAADAA